MECTYLAFLRLIRITPVLFHVKYRKLPTIKVPLPPPYFLLYNCHTQKNPTDVIIFALNIHLYLKKFRRKKRYLQGIKNSGFTEFPPFSASNTLFHCLLARMVSSKKFEVIWVISVYVSFFFSCFQDFSLSFISLSMMCLSMVFLKIYPAWDSLSSWIHKGMSFTKHERF